MGEGGCSWGSRELGGWGHFQGRLGLPSYRGDLSWSKGRSWAVLPGLAQQSSCSWRCLLLQWGGCCCKYFSSRRESCSAPSGVFWAACTFCASERALWKGEHTWVGCFPPGFSRRDAPPLQFSLLFSISAWASYTHLCPNSLLACSLGIMGCMEAPSLPAGSAVHAHGRTSSGQALILVPHLWNGRSITPKPEFLLFTHLEIFFFLWWAYFICFIYTDIYTYTHGFMP